MHFTALIARAVKQARQPSAAPANMHTPVAPSPPPSSPPSGGGDDEEVVLSLTLAGVMLALGIVLQQLLHKKEVKWVTESAA